MLEIKRRAFYAEKRINGIRSWLSIMFDPRRYVVYNNKQHPAVPVVSSKVYQYKLYQQCLDVSSSV